MAFVADSILTSELINAPIGSIRTSVKTANFGPLVSVNIPRGDPELSVPIPAFQTWAIKCFFVYSSSILADIQLALSVPSGTSGLISQYGPDTSFPTGWDGERNMSVNLVDTVLFLGGGGVSTGLPSFLRGYLKTASTPGNVGVRFAQFGTDPTETTLYVGSRMTLIRLA